jgi:hypothetical protein
MRDKHGHSNTVDGHAPVVRMSPRRRVDQRRSASRAAQARSSRSRGLENKDGTLGRSRQRFLRQARLPEKAERVGHPHLFGGPASYPEEARARHQDAERSSTGERDVQPVSRVQELDVSRGVVRGRRRGRLENDRSLLALELVDRSDSASDAEAFLKAPLDFSDLEVVRLRRGGCPRG